MKTVKRKKRVRIGNLKSGQLFTLDSIKEMALKSEYYNSKGGCECYILGSGEVFRVGTSTSKELNNLLVYPVDLK